MAYGLAGKARDTSHFCRIVGFNRALTRRVGEICLNGANCL
jgi:hypothetical protein